MAMQTVEQLIVALGGTVAVAVEVDAPPSTVSSWKSANSIPRWRMAAIRRLAKRRGVEIAPDFGVKPRQAPERAA